MRQDLQLTNFTRGEVSPRLKGRTDYEHYFDACEAVVNMVVQPQGGATRRPGTLFKATAKDQVTTLFRVREIPFVFSTVQAYQLEFGGGYVRVDMNDAPVLNVINVAGAANNGGGLIRLQLANTTGLYTGNAMVVSGVLGTVEANSAWIITVIDATHVDLQGSAFVHAYGGGGVTSTTVEIPVPYTAADIALLQWTQSADTLYLCHPLYPTATLTRSSHTAWTYAGVAFQDGPYLSVNATTTTLTPTDAAGATTLTASSAVGINNGQGFLATDLGRLVRVRDGNNAWFWGTITGITSPTVVSFTYGAAITGGANGAYTGAISPTQQWQLGKWSITTGFPYVPIFWQQRLVLAGTNNQPNAIEASITGNFPVFSPTAADGTVPSNAALDWVISDDQVNAIRWLSPAGSAAAMQFGIGTTQGEKVLQQATTSQALSPTNVQVYGETEYGGASNVRAQRIGKAVLFADRPGRRVREWQWAWAVNGYLGPDLTVDCEHITRPVPSSLPGIVQMAWQQSPLGVLWCVRGDGALIGLTYLPEQKVVAAHRHVLGGQYYGGPPLVESVSVIPSIDGSYDELSLLVIRTINGVPTRFKEAMTRYFDGQPGEQAWFMDCAIQTNLTFPNATLTPPALANTQTLAAGAPQFTGTGIFVANAAVFAGGAADVGLMIRVNNGVAIVTAPIDTTHVTAQVIRPLTNLAPSTAGNWSATAQQATFGNGQSLAYMNGETAQIIGDGADMGQQQIAGGQVTLPGNQVASLVTVGFPTSFALVGMPFEPARATISAHGKAKRIDHMYLRFHETLGCNFGIRKTDDMTFAQADEAEPLETRSASDLLGEPPALFSGILRLPNPGGYDVEQQLEVFGGGPMPCTVLAIGARADVGDLEVEP